jgi:predicted DNA-binding transcriptional regulator YafY
MNVSLRQIEKDLEHMQEDFPMGYEAPISYDKKRKGYFYTDPNFTIQAFGLKPDDIITLLFYARTLEQYNGFKIFENILKTIEKVIANSGIVKSTKELVADRALLQTEKIQMSKGVELIQPILKAILEKQIIEFNYQKFEDLNPNKKILSPILLKEDKNYWYVIGLPDGKNTPTTFALDRISGLIITNKYFTPPSFDVDNYFKYSFGVTVPDTKPIKVILSFSKFQGNYIKALPIHETQKIIRDNKNELRISIQVKPTYEFYSKILGYGSDVKVILPRSVAKEIKQQFQTALKNYN